MALCVRDFHSNIMSVGFVKYLFNDLNSNSTYMIITSQDNKQIIYPYYQMSDTSLGEPLVIFLSVLSTVASLIFCCFVFRMSCIR